MKRTVLIVDDERNMLMVMKMALEDADFRVLTADNVEEATGYLRDPDLDVVLSDLKMPGMDGMELLKYCRQHRPDVPVIVVTAYGSIRTAIECIQAGANNFLTKPFEPEELQIAAQNAVRYRDLVRENLQYHAVFHDKRRKTHLVGDAPVMQRLREQIQQVAPYKTNILITGESGTGKEVVARSIHELGPRAEHPWVAINCSAIPHELMESELFGYVKGAFTGAINSRLGRLEQANGGTLFLDEISDLELDLQAKLLRVLQEREFSPVGSDSIRRVDVRFISATNRKLSDMVKANKFREDLFYRLDVYNIHVPPLRERKEDIPLLAQTFMAQFRVEMDKQVEGFTENALKALTDYHWPGNVRELRNAVERSLLTCHSNFIRRADLPDRVFAHTAVKNTSSNKLTEVERSGLDDWLADNERKVIMQALKECEGVQVNAARLLGITERSLWHRIKKLDIQVSKKVK